MPPKVDFHPPPQSTTSDVDPLTKSPPLPSQNQNTSFSFILCLPQMDTQQVPSNHNSHKNPTINATSEVMASRPNGICSPLTPHHPQV